MAVWKSENCILTTKGEEALNSLAVGGGKLTITRIVTGSSYVSPSSLRTLTRIPNEKQTFKIQDITSNLEGSVISIECSNVGLNESYNVYQIGVYATHPSIYGEFLYWVGQCETDTADFFPSASEIPVTLTFGIFLYNLNSKDITFKVEYANYVTKDFLSKNLRKTGSILDISDSNQIILKNADNEELSRTSINNFLGASSMQNGSSGLVPPPNRGEQNKVLKGDGTWGIVSISAGGTGATTAEAARANLGIDAAIAEAKTVLKVW